MYDARVCVCARVVYVYRHRHRLCLGIYTDYLTNPFPSAVVAHSEAPPARRCSTPSSPGTPGMQCALCAVACVGCILLLIVPCDISAVLCNAVKCSVLHTSA
jgi:hypothetical protein